MLEEIPTRHIQETVVRFASRQTDTDFLRDQEMSREQIAEMKELLNSRGMSDSLEELINTPFDPKRRLWKRGYYASRFSDGSFPVLYFSLEAQTARAEVRHRFCAEFAGRPSDHRTAWFSRFTCDFRGNAKDLRPMQPKWPDLTHGSDYTFCNRLGEEAVSADVDGLLAPSARKSGGTNVPVFARRALSNPREHALVGVTCGASNGTIED